nr:23 kDa jasmonate-induced protein-like isoform X1 [Malus domestica]
MAYNVFGNPITDETLKGMPEYADKQIGRLDRAYVALNMKNAAEKDFNARTHVEKLKEQYGDGVSTLCLVYNATGETIRYAYKKDWYGHIGNAPYPPLIANGQWGAFLHVKTAGESSGSNAAVVYRGLNIVNEECDWMLSWSNPWDRTKSDNTVITEIRGLNHFESYWSLIYGYLEKGQAYSKDRWNGCVSIMSTGSDTSPIVEAILTLENV